MKMHIIESAIAWLKNNYPGDLEDFKLSALEYLAENLDTDLESITDALGENHQETLDDLFAMSFLFDWFDPQDRHFDDFIEENININDDDLALLKGIRFEIPFSVYHMIDETTCKNLLTGEELEIEGATHQLKPDQAFMAHLYKGMILGPCVFINDTSWVDVARSEIQNAIEDSEALEEMGINPDLPLAQRKIQLLKMSSSQMIITWLSMQMSSLIMDDIFSFVAPDGEDFQVCHRHFIMSEHSVKIALKTLHRDERFFAESKSDRSFHLLINPEEEPGKENTLANITVMDDGILMMALSEKRDQDAGNMIRDLFSDFIQSETSEQRSVDETMKLLLDHDKDLQVKKASVH